VGRWRVIHRGDLCPQILRGVWSGRVVRATLTSVNLYRDAMLFPGTLRGRNRVVTLAQLQERGVSRHAAQWQTNHGRVVRAHRGAYLLGRTQPDLLDRIRAALLVSPANCAVGFHTAAALIGFGVVATEAVHIVVPQGGPLPHHRDIRVHQSVLPVGEPVWRLGIPCTPAARTAVDLARTVHRPLALSILDAALANGACDKDALVHEVTRHVGLSGVRQARDLIAFSDPRSQCSQESHLRLVIHDGGLLDFEPQVPVYDDYGRARYYLDLADPGRRVGAEHDGASHITRDRLRDDRARHNWLESAGWRMRYFSDRDLYTRPAEIVRILRSACSDRPPR
jgi:very-short-patch-repair endonuclease